MAIHTVRAQRPLVNVIFAVTTLTSLLCLTKLLATGVAFFTIHFLVFPVEQETGTTVIKL